MSLYIWYISKYVSPPSSSNVGGRGYLLMKEFSRCGYQPIIITSDSNQLAQVPKFDDNYLMQKVDGIELWWVRTLKFQVAKSMKRMLSWLHFEWRLFLMPKSSIPKPDVIIVSSLSLLTVVNGLLLSKKYQCRLVFEVRDIWPLTLTEEGGFKRFNPFIIGLSLIEYLGYKYADLIVGTMPNLKEHVTNVLSHTKRTECIPMGIDSNSLLDFQPLPDDYIKTYLPDGKFIVVHAGTIGITNALDTFFDCAKLLGDNLDIHFLVVGDGDLRNHYIEKYGHLQNLTFAPKVPKQMVQSILEKCDLLYFSVHNSAVWKYGQSLNKVIDYMLAGRPIVASYSGYPSMINEAECGTFVPAGDITALRDEIIRYHTIPLDERLTIGLRGREWILANRNYQKLAKNYLSILFEK